MFTHGSMSRSNNMYGELSEWFMVTVLKTVVRQRTGGSNPSLSADKYLNFLLNVLICILSLQI